MRPKLILALLLSFPLICMAQSQTGSGVPRPARNPVEGAKIFQLHCASCHGADGRGHGPASVSLQYPASDLTLISQRNGGKFPYQRVKETIEGKRPVFANGNREMPVWGPVFHQVEADQDWGEVRLDAITRHLQSMQK
jgi:mono/diheme cytochrome c family protein